MPAGEKWRDEVADVVHDLRVREGWSSSVFARSIRQTQRQPSKTASQEHRLDTYLPGWRTDADETTLETLRVGVGALSVLARAAAAGYDVASDAEAAPLLRTLVQHADELAPHHRAALAALHRLPDGRSRQASRRPSSTIRAVVTAATTKAEPAPAAPRTVRPSSKLTPPDPVGEHPLAGQWVRASSDLITVEVYVVTVSDAAAAVKVWVPTTGRTRLMALAEWSLVVIDDPRA